jgi:pimeloyl-ACP methyl ester carboxylesterase
MTLTATLPQHRHLRSLSPHGFHRVVYYEWGDPGNAHVTICAHGLGRNGRDFDVLAEALASTSRVLAIDMPGRGDSEWLADPHDYVFPTYLTTLTALIARSGADTVDWVGTSMGGLLGMTIAALPKSPIARLVVNDIGPAIEAPAVARIASYIGQDPVFATYAEIERYIREISAPFGNLTDAQWAHIAQTNVRQGGDGRWRLAYDPGIAVPFKDAPAPQNLWGLWDAIRCPTLVLRGAQSDLLSASTATEMSARGPRPAIVEYPNVGHAPMLLTPLQIDPVLRFLRG